MRILFVTPLYLPWLGGLEVLCSQLLDELRDRGHEVAVVTAVNTLNVPRGVVEVNGVPVLRTDAHHITTRREPRELLLIQREVAEFVDDFAPDIAHAHDAGPLLWLYQRGARGRRPLLVTVHVVLTRHLPDRLTAMSKLLAAADWVTGVSEDVVSDTLTFAPHVRDRISTIQNGVVPPGPAVPVPDGPAQLLSVGRLVPQKGFDRAIDALAMVVRRRGDVCLTIAGEGPSDRALGEQIHRLGLDGHAMLAGRVEHDRIHELMSAATALVMPSRFEGLPLVALEAAWMARPVVATDAPGLRCAIDDGVNGLVVAEDDTAALAGAILRLVEDRAEARRLGAQARALIERTRSLGDCVDDYESLYQRLVLRRAS